MNRTALFCLVLGTSLIGAELDPAALTTWNQYVAGAQLRAEKRAKPGSEFLWIDESPELLAKVRTGEIVLAPVGVNPQKLPNGMIHHWIGTMFLPNVSLSEAASVVRDCPRYKEYFPSNVIDSKVMKAGEERDSCSMLLKSTSYFVKSALDADYESQYMPVDSHRMYSVTQTTRIQEVVGYGSASANRLPEGEGTGAIWRLMNINRYAERDGGVYLEVETIVLSRGIPAAVRWAMDGVVRRAVRSSMASSLKQTEEVVMKRVEASNSHRRILTAGRAAAVSGQ